MRNPDCLSRSCGDLSSSPAPVITASVDDLEGNAGARVRQMRQTQPTCLPPPAIATAAEQFAPADALTSAACGWRPPVEYAHTLGYECTLLGRKFPAETAPAVAALFADCKSQLRMSDAQCAAEAARLLRLS